LLRPKAAPPEEIVRAADDAVDVFLRAYAACPVETLAAGAARLPT
jgi:hypothetical protein